jgi:hypothetical protein
MSRKATTIVTLAVQFELPSGSSISEAISNTLGALREYKREFTGNLPAEDVSYFYKGIVRVGLTKKETTYA